jgi:hypothetical protein
MQNHMAEENQEGQKTVVSFVVGLLIGGLLVWAFSGPADDSTTKTSATEDETSVETEGEMSDEVETTTEAETETTESEVERPVLSVGEGRIVIADQEASASVSLESATYPVSEGWVGVRDYQGEQLGALLGVVRFSEEQGLVPTEVVLQRPTTAGREYAVVVYRENGDRQFNLAEDVQIDTIFATFTAQ